jgi:putative copper resistance protein D
MQTYLIAARFIHFAAVTVIFGVALFSLYAGNAAWRLLAGRNLRLWLAGGVGVAIISALLWLDAASATMSGTWEGARDPQILRTILIETGFGRMSLWRLVLAVMLLAILLSWQGALAKRAACLVIVFLSGLLAASVAGTGHAVMLADGAGALLVTAQALHMLAAGAWLGGLLPLVSILWRLKREAHPAPLDDLAFVLSRFSKMGAVAISTIAATGALSAVLIVGDLRESLAIPFGRVLIAKICVFLLMTGLAADNRWRLSSAIRNPVRSAATAATLDLLARNVAIEIGFGAVILGLVSLLGTLSPVSK